MKIELHSDSPDKTEQIAETIGRACKGGEIIELKSDLGGGKTTFVRGLAKGIGSKDIVASPTFTVSKVYTAPMFSLHHFDFYRLEDAGIVGHELEDLVGNSAVILAIEWGDAVQSVLPEQRLTITLHSIGETDRRLEISASKSMKYLVGEL